MECPERLQTGLMMFAEKLSKIHVLSIVQRAMITLVPISLAGSFALIIMYFPYIDSFVPVHILTVIRTVLSPIPGVTLSLLALYICGSISYTYAEEQKLAIYPFIVTGIFSFLILTPNFITVEGNTVGGVIPTSYLGAKGMFVGIFVSYFSSAVMRWFIQKNYHQTSRQCSF